MKIRILAACIAAALAGCTVGPNYVRPTVDTPPAWRIDYPKAADVANLKWWEQFGDPVLNDLVETALRDNRDLRVAAARVDQFIGALTSTGSQLYPQIGYGADASRARASTEGFPPLPPTLSPYFSLYNVSLGASWQTDLFGRVRRQTEAAQAQVYASEQGQRGVVLTLVSGVATSYIVLRSLDRQLEIAQATARNFEGTLRIFELRYKAGMISMTELSQIRSQTQQARAAIPQFQQAIATQENLISILLGRNPGPIPRGKTIDQLIAPQIPGDLPATLLQRRPDILGAEQNLVAANANIGAARALYYPNLSLQAALATTATATGALFSGPAAAGLIGASLAGPIFTFGGIEGQVASAEAGERAALAVYQQTILNALRETNDALSGSQKRAEEFTVQRERVVALREFARLSKLRFDKGVSGYLEVLVAENELFAAELASVSLQASSYAQIVNVYQAMGGGWVDIAAGMAPKPQGRCRVHPLAARRDRFTSRVRPTARSSRGPRSAQRVEAHPHGSGTGRDLPPASGAGAGHRPPRRQSPRGAEPHDRPRHPVQALADRDGRGRLEVRFAARVLLRVTLTPDVGAAARVELRRETPVPEQIELLRGESRRIDHGGAVPANFRGRVRTDAIDLDVPAMRVPISTHRSSAVAEPASLPAAVPDAARSPSRRLVPATTLIVRSGGDPNRHDACRLTVCEPMFALVGAGIDSNARFQLCSSCASANRPTRTRAVVVLPGAPRRLAHRRQFGRPRGRLRT